MSAHGKSTCASMDAEPGRVEQCARFEALTAPSKHFRPKGPVGWIFFHCPGIVFIAVGNVHDVAGSAANLVTCIRQREEVNKPCEEHNARRFGPHLSTRNDRHCVQIRMPIPYLP